MADNATIIRGLYEAFARGDIAAVLGALHEQAEWNEAEHFTLWPGGPGHWPAGRAFEWAMA